MKTDYRKIQFHYLVSEFHFPRRSEVKRFLFDQLKAHGKRIENINYVFCDDKYLLGLNIEYLKHNTLTDIITFELSSTEEDILAEIYISIDRVRENAIKFKTTFRSELLRVMFHGVLHLLGLKDKTENEAQVMRAKEDELLNLFHISRETETTRKH